MQNLKNYWKPNENQWKLQMQKNYWKPKENQCFFEPNFKNQLKPKENQRKINENIKKQIENLMKTNAKIHSGNVKKGMIQANPTKTL